MKQIKELNQTLVATKEEVDTWCSSHKIGDPIPEHIRRYGQKVIEEKTAEAVSNIKEINIILSKK